MKYILAMISDNTEWQRMTPEQAEAFDQGITAFNDERLAQSLGGDPGTGADSSLL